jgi:hypothetical protein
LGLLAEIAGHALGKFFSKSVLTGSPAAGACDQDRERTVVFANLAAFDMLSAADVLV